MKRLNTQLKNEPYQNSQDSQQLLNQRIRKRYHKNFGTSAVQWTAHCLFSLCVGSYVKLGKIRMAIPKTTQLRNQTKEHEHFYLNEIFCDIL